MLQYTSQIHSMAYLPKHKQKAKDKLQGILKDLKSGETYNGPFVKDFLGNFTKGSKYSSKAEPLKFVPEWKELESDSQQGVPISTAFKKPSEADYQKGTFKRFFVKQSNIGKVTEVDSNSYKALKKEGKLTRRVIQIEWYVTGNPEDEIIDGYLYPGTKAKNQDVIDQAEKLLPGIGSQILKDPSQFVRK